MASKAVELRLKTLKVLNDDVESHLAHILDECEAAASVGRFQHSVTTNKMKNAQAVQEALKQHGFLVEQQANKDSRGVIEGHTLVINW